MSALERMEERILQDARTKAQEIVRAASAEAEELLAQAKGLAGRRREEELARSAQRAEEARKRILTLAELEVRKRMLATRASLVDEVFAEAARRLGSLEPDRYEAYLKRQMHAAVAEAPSDAIAEVVMSRRDRESLGPRVVAAVNSELAAQGRKIEVRLSEDQGEFAGGFVLRLGSVEVNCTFDAALAREREALMVEVAAILFG